MLAEEGLILLGDDFLPWIILAFGAAMVVGNVLALVRPPQERSDPGSKPTKPKGPGQTRSKNPDVKPPVGRALVMILIGLVAAVWGLASLIK